MLVKLQKAWCDGTAHLLLEPLELLEKLAVVTLRPEARGDLRNGLRGHGIDALPRPPRLPQRRSFSTEERGLARRSNPTGSFPIWPASGGAVRGRGDADELVDAGGFARLVEPDAVYGGGVIHGAWVPQC